MSNDPQSEFLASLAQSLKVGHIMFGQGIGRIVDQMTHEEFQLPGLASERSVRGHEQICRDRQALIRILSDDFMHISQIRAALGIDDHANVVSDLQVLRHEGRVEMGKRGYYRLAPKHPH